MALLAKEWAAVAVAAVGVAAPVALAAWGVASPALPAGILALLGAEGAKMTFLMKRFSSPGGKSQMKSTVVAEALTFVIAAVVVVLFATPKSEANVVEIATLCATLVAFRIASGLALSARS